MQDDMLGDALDTLLGDLCAPSRVRQIEQGGSAEAMWRGIEASGFCDTLVPESHGGAGLGLQDAFALFEACGRHVVPVPLAETMLARALIAGRGAPAPNGSIALAHAGPAELVVHLGAVADWLLLGSEGTLALFDLKAAERQPTGDGSLEALVPRLEKPEMTLATSTDLRAQHALLLSAQMSGAMRRVLQTSLQFANERVQFGRSIGKFQAIQHQLSQMAEQAEAARMAARLGCATREITADALLCAMAKAATSAAVVPLTAFAHAVHGAIGVTQEYDLQLLTRRLHQWRITAGSESFWHERIGRALVSTPDISLPDFARTRLGTQFSSDIA